MNIKNKPFDGEKMNKEQKHATDIQNIHNSRNQNNQEKSDFRLVYLAIEGKWKKVKGDFF